MLRAIAWLLALLSVPALAAERPVDYAKSEIAFTVTQMGVGVSGHFRRFSGRVDLDTAKPGSAHAEIEVEIASISTGEPDADTEALKKPWLDAAGFPHAKFSSSALRALGGERYEARGTLSLRGRERPLTLPFTLKPLPDGGAVAGGEFTLRRSDFGIGGGEWNEGDLVANEVPVRFRLVLGPPAR